MPPTIDIEPLRLLVLADLHASREEPPVQELSDASDFQGLLDFLAPMIRFEVPNHLGTSPATLDVVLKLSSLRDLTPAGLLELPALEPARALLQLLGKGGQVGAAELSAALSTLGLERLRQALDTPPPVAPPPSTPPAATPAPAPASGEGVDHILSLVDLPSHEDRAASAIGSVVGSIGRQRGAPATEQRAIFQSALTAIGRQLDEILHHPELQALEAGWRGLRLLLSRTDLRHSFRLQVLHAPRSVLLAENLLDRIQADLQGAGSDLVLCPSHLCDPAADAVVAERLADLAAELRAPLCLSVGVPFFGSPGESGDLRLTSVRLEPAAYVRWRALRTKEEARWLGVIGNRFLLRPPYAPEKGEAALAYGESCQRDEHYLWGDPVWLVGALAFRSFVKLGWPSEILGSPQGRVDDLPTRPRSRSGGSERELPVEHFLGMEQVEDLAKGGFMCLHGGADTDAAILLAAPPFFHQPAPGPRTGLMVGFPYQVVTGRVVRLVERWRFDLMGRPADEQARSLEASLRELTTGTGPGASATVSLTRPASDDTAPEVNLELRLGAAVLGGVRVALRFGLAG